jgi:hypothetical protein
LVAVAAVTRRTLHPHANNPLPICSKLYAIRERVVGVSLPQNGIRHCRAAVAVQSQAAPTPAALRRKPASGPPWACERTHRRSPPDAPRCPRRCFPCAAKPRPHEGMPNCWDRSVSHRPPCPHGQARRPPACRCQRQSRRCAPYGPPLELHRQNYTLVAPCDELTLFHASTNMYARTRTLVRYGHDGCGLGPKYPCVHHTDPCGANEVRSYGADAQVNLDACTRRSAKQP